MGHRVLLRIYSGLTSLLFAIVFSAQVLGFIGWYTPLPVILLTGSMTIFGIWLYSHFDNGWFDAVASPQSTPRPALSGVLIACAAGIMVIVFVSRMVLWTQSSLAVSVPDDFFLYHSIKAIDLARSGSYWNLSIPFGQYPLGYEALFAFPLLLTGTMAYGGLVQALVTIWLWLTLYLLLRRYTVLSAGLALGGATAILFVPFFYSTVLIIGKNDVLLSTTILAAIVHAPFGDEKNRFHPIGLAFVTMIAIATKGNALYILPFVWLVVLVRWWQAFRRGKATAYLSLPVFALCIGLMFPGGLWVIRNYVLMGQTLSPEVTKFFTTSIIASLDRPALYTSGTESAWLGLYALVSVVMVGLMQFSERFRWTDMLLLVVLVIAFMMTPLSAFHTPASTVLHVEWRYNLHGLMFYGILGVTLFDMYLERFYQWVGASPVRSRAAMVALIVVSGGLLSFLDVTDFFGDYQSPIAYPEDSVYEYVDNTVDSGVVKLLDASWFYVMYPNPNLKVIEGESYPLGLDIYEQPVPDYVVSHLPVSSLMDILADSPFAWELVYQHDDGRVYRRIPAES